MKKPWLSFFSPVDLAYIDPGSGSYVVEIIIAMVVGLGFGVKMHWRRLVNFFKRKKDDR